MTRVLPRVGGGGRSLSSSGRLGGDWRWSAAYGTGMRAAESRYGASGLGGQGCLRAGFQEGSGARVRVALGYVEKGFSSRANGRVPSSKIKGAANLTDGLTAGLTGRLTEVLTVGLTE